MRTNKLLATLSTLCCASALIACGSETDDPPGPGAGGGVATGGSSGAGTGGGPGAGGDGAGGMMPGCDLDFTDLPTTPLSLRNDIIPLFGPGCALASACHSQDRPKAGLPLAPRMVDLDEELANRIHMNLLLPSMTAPEATRVVPGDPANSFLVQKMADTQGDHGYACTPQDPATTTAAEPCGNEMPPGAGLCEQADGRFDTIAAWIQQGALNN